MTIAEEEPKRTPQHGQKQPNPVAGTVQIGGESTSLFSPRFKSLAAMAGWDEESIIIASLIVEDTPDRSFKNKRRTDDLQFKTPPTNSRRKRRPPTSPILSVPVTAINLDETVKEGEEEKSAKEGTENRKIEPNVVVDEGDKQEVISRENSGVSCSHSVLSCLDKLREELSCAICLEICFEPSTTSCGHSFCKKCLRSAADKCGKKCPKCRQLISNGRSCNVNTVLWNTIQMLFPQEVEARKAAGVSSNREAAKHQCLQTRSNNNNNNNTNLRNRNGRPSGVTSRRRGVVVSEDDEEEDLVTRLSRRDRNRSTRPPAVSDREFNVRRRGTVLNQDDEEEEDLVTRLSRRESSGGTRRRETLPSQDEDAALAQRLRREDLSRLLGRGRRIPSQDEDAALAQRLQREEFMEAFRGGTTTQETAGNNYLSSARANLRAMASRAINIRMRNRPI